MKTNPKLAERFEEQPRIIGRDELNFAEFPIAAIAHRIPGDCKELVFHDVIRDQATSEVITRKLTVTGDSKLGLPTSLDEDVIVAMMCVTKEANNFSTRIVPFSRMGLVELLGWPRNGQSFRRLDESLNRWLGVTLRYENAWWDKAAQTWVNESFHIIDNLTIYDQQTVRRIKRNPGQTSLPLSSFAWNDVVFRSFQAENLKRLDLSLYFKLALAPSKRAYRFLDKRFYRESRLTFDLKTFACGKIGLSDTYSAAKIKEKLQPALDELEGVGFLEPLSRDKRYEKISPGEWKIVLSSGKQEVLAEAAAKPDVPPLVAELTGRGVSGKIAADLVRDHEAETIRQQIEILDWRLAGKKADKIDDPAAWLVSAIKHPHAAPKGFTSAAERQRQEEAKQARERADAEERRRKQEADAQARREKELITGFWDGLSKEQKAEHETAAIAQADAEVLKLIEPGPMKRYGMTVMRHSYARKLLQAQGKLPPSEA